MLFSQFLEVHFLLPLPLPYISIIKTNNSVEIMTGFIFIFCDVVFASENFANFAFNGYFVGLVFFFFFRALVVVFILVSAWFRGKCGEREQSAHFTGLGLCIFRGQKTRVTGGMEFSFLFLSAFSATKQSSGLLRFSIEILVMVCWVKYLSVVLMDIYANWG